MFEVPHPRRGKLRRRWTQKYYDPLREDLRDFLRIFRWSVTRLGGVAGNARVLPAYRRFVSHMNGHAQRRYEPRFYPGEATLFITAQKRYLHEDLRLAMRHRIQSTEVINLPGSRSTLFIKPTVDKLAHELNACLQRAERQP
jgi:hypothetical protein